jgi:TonB-linked SusC/RagA family outer membrane protein
MGGDSTVQYYLHGGYSSTKGLENVGERINFNRVLLRSDLGVQLSKIIKLDLGITGWMDLSRFAAMGKDEMFDIMSSYPAYATPMQIGDSAFIVNREYPENLLSKLTSEGFTESIKRTVNFNLGLTFNFNHLVKGLSMKHDLSLDINNEVMKGKGGNPYLYEPEFTTNSMGEDTMLLHVYTHENKVLDIEHQEDEITRYYTYYFNLDYDREFGNDHYLNTDLLYFQNALERRGKSGDVKSQMINGKLAYSYRNKYVIDGYLICTGTQKLIDKNKFDIFPGFGIAWIASSEPFLNGSSSVNFLKVRASIGRVGLINTSEYYIYRDTWYSWGTDVTFGTKDKNSDYTTYTLNQTGNPDAKWPFITKINVGIDGIFLDNSINIVIDGYLNKFSNQLARLYDLHSEMEGDSIYIPFENYNHTERWGIESGISYNNRIADFYYSIGGNFSYSIEKNTQIAELDYPDTYRKQNNQRSDAIWGLVSSGFFQDENDIYSSDVQMFGAVYPGDIKYIDQNDDNIIDEKDKVIIGNTSPDISVGVHLHLGYKNFSLFLQGTGIFGSDLVLNNPYYWNYGRNKYSSIMQNDFPRLSTFGSTNNYRLSDYWILNGSYFRLKTAELSYQLPSAANKILKAGIKFFVRGNNIITFSKMKELDPENIDAGISSYPLYRMFSGGLSISF